MKLEKKVVKLVPGFTRKKRENAEYKFRTLTKSSASFFFEVRFAEVSFRELYKFFFFRWERKSPFWSGLCVLNYKSNVAFVCICILALEKGKAWIDCGGNRKATAYKLGPQIRPNFGL